MVSLLAKNFPQSKACLAPAQPSGYTPSVVLEIVKYGDPVLRQKGKRIEAVTEEIRQLAADMVQTMYAADGVGLAAQQVAKPLQLTVLDAAVTDRPSEMFINGELQELAKWMPLILVNPVISKPEGEQIGSEGCLSIPDVSAQIRRSSKISVSAQTLEGKPFTFECTGLLARAIQHEVDHLNGILFIDRMDAATKASFSGKLKKLQKETEAALDAKPKSKRALARM